MTLVTLVAVNLMLGFGHQLLLVWLLGASGTDLIFSAQAPFIMVAAAAASIVTNVFTPALAADHAEGPGSLLRALHRAIVFGSIALGLTILALMLAADSLIFASHIVAAPQFKPAMLIFCAGGAATSAISLYGAQLQAAGRAGSLERSQLMCSAAGLALAWPLTTLGGVAGASASLALRPVAAALVLWVLCRRYLRDRDADAGATTAANLLSRAARMLPSHALLKSTPIIDRALLGYAAPATLSAYVLMGQMAGAALTLFERTKVRQMLVELGRTARTDLQHVYRNNLRSVLRIAAGLAAGGGVLVIALALVAARLMPGLNLSDLLMPLVVFAVLQVGLGMLSQTTASILYASGRTDALSLLSTVSWVISIVARLLLFLLVGLTGFLAGTLLYQVLNALLFHGAARSRHGS